MTIELGGYGGRGAQYWDNGPKTRVFSYAATGIAPHAFVNRFFYTPPVGRLAILEYCGWQVMRRAAAAPANSVYVFASLFPGFYASANLATMEFVDNTLGIEHKRDLTNIGLLTDQDSIGLYTEDDSTGGSCDYWVGLKVTEFDRQSLDTLY